MHVAGREQEIVDTKETLESFVPRIEMSGGTLQKRDKIFAV